jgi:tetratricopeptide (TPR) repeat protein
MLRNLMAVVMALASGSIITQSDTDGLVQQPWFEVRTAHFILYSCGSIQEVRKLAAHLEQFRDAYSLMAGAQTVASPPIVVMVFPDASSFRSFKPLYQGQPGYMSGFFHTGSDENLIALALASNDRNSMEIIFHEYAHLLLRHNGRIWPVWLVEGMADCYANFEVNGQKVRIGAPRAARLRVLAEKPLLSLKELFAVTRDSPQYNEREQKPLFYAQSWLLTHYLTLGDNADYKARFAQFTVLLRQGQAPEQAFTNAFKTSLSVMGDNLRRYLADGKFEVFEGLIRADVSSPKPMAARSLAPTETGFRLGNLLLRLDRLEDAEKYFLLSRTLSPQNPQAWEGLGLLAVQRGQSSEAVRCFKEATQRGSRSFQVYYHYGCEQHRLSAASEEWYSRIGKDAAVTIRAAFLKSIALMPAFGPAHKRLGFLELIQGEDLKAAETQLQAAIKLEPEDEETYLWLAQAQVQRKNFDAARRTLESLRLPTVEPKLRVQAAELLRKINR